MDYPNLNIKNEIKNIITYQLEKYFFTSVDIDNPNNKLVIYRINLDTGEN